MKLEEAILHAQQVAEGCPAGDRQCAYQHDKLADWLKELKAYQATGLTPEDVERLIENKKEGTDMGRMSDIAIECGSAPLCADIISRLDECEKRYGFANFAGTDGVETYVLLQLPDSKQGKSCVNFCGDYVAAYGLRVEAEDKVPLGGVSLLIWESTESFNNGANPIANCPIASIYGSDSAADGVPF